MRNEFSQVHEVPDGYEATFYTYETIPVFDIARLSIYLVCFVGFFMIFKTLVRLI